MKPLAILALALIGSVNIAHALDPAASAFGGGDQGPPGMDGAMEGAPSAIPEQDDEIESMVEELIPPPPTEVQFTDDEFNKYVDVTVERVLLEQEIARRDQAGEDRDELEQEFLNGLKGIFERNDLTSDRYIAIDHAVLSSPELGEIFEERAAERHPELLTR